MNMMLKGGKIELTRFGSQPFLDRLGHKARRADVSALCSQG